MTEQPKNRHIDPAQTHVKSHSILTTVRDLVKWGSHQQHKSRAGKPGSSQKTKATAPRKKKLFMMSWKKIFKLGLL